MSEVKNMNTCQECGCIHSNLIEITVEGETRLVCPDCAVALGYVRCWQCDEWVISDDTHTDKNGHIICDDCCDAYYYVCDDCGELVHEDYIRETGTGIYVCTDCLYDNWERCQCCGEWFPSGEGHNDDYDNFICDGCFEEDYAECAECGRVVHRDYANWDDAEDAYFCNSCWSEAPDIRNYSYKPAPKFHFRKSEETICRKAEVNPLDTVLTFGLEVEVDKGSRRERGVMTKALAAMGEPIYMKHDGSLSENGVEIVTHPCSLAYHTYELGWGNIAKTCVENSYRSHDTSSCGLHIHVGRQAMGKTAEEKNNVVAGLSCLFYNLWEELVKFSRRRQHQLDDWANKPRFPMTWDEEQCNYVENIPEDDNELLWAAIDAVNGSRYMSVNIQNAHTVEIRIFRGTLKRNTILASIQLVNNLTKYAMTHSPRECLNATWADVIGIEQFKELKAYCEERGIV